MADLKTFQRGETVVIDCQSYNSKTNAATTPGTSILVTVKDPVPTAVVNAQAMANQGTGDHTYGYTIAADAVFGTYKYEVTAIHSGRTTKAQSSFIVEAATT